MKNEFVSTQLKNVSTLVAVLAVILVAFMPSVSSAYAVLGQSATQLTEDTFLLQIDYRLNYLTYDTFAPVLAHQVNDISITAPYVQYSFVDEAGDKVTGVESASIVLSDAEVVDGQYYFADRDSSPFTLMSIVQLSPEQQIEGGSLALQIDWLPFTLKKAGEEQATAVREADLADFQTPLINW